MPTTLEAVIVSIAEIAELLNVTKRTAQRYAARDDFPAPARRLAIGNVWLQKDVEKWAKRTLPLASGAPAHRPKAG